MKLKKMLAVALLAMSAMGFQIVNAQSLSPSSKWHWDIPQTEESLRKHPRMTLQNRAKIFSPFSPLRGYDEQLAAEKQRTERVQIGRASCRERV